MNLHPFSKARGDIGTILQYMHYSISISTYRCIGGNIYNTITHTVLYVLYTGGLVDEFAPIFKGKGQYRYYTTLIHYSTSISTYRWIGGYIHNTITHTILYILCTGGLVDEFAPVFKGKG